MKRILYSVSALLFMAAFSVSAQQQVQPAGAPQNELLQEKVLIDFAKLDQAGVNDEIRFDKWRIKLSGLSDVPESRVKSDLKMVDVDSTKLEGIDETFNKALGIRINFAYGYNNDWAQIRTENPISAFRIPENEEGSGVLRNVGPISEVSLLVKGMNYMHSIEIRMLDQDNKFKNVNFGGLYFNGWKRLVIKNGDYIGDKRKRDIMKIHMYPSQPPQLRFDSIVLYKSPGEKGGDFVTYVKDVKVKFEPFYKREIKDIDDEKVWGIMKEEDDKKSEREDLIRFLKYSGSTAEEEYLKEEQKRKESGKQ